LTVCRAIVYAILASDETLRCYKDASLSKKLAEIRLTPSTEVKYTVEGSTQAVKHFRFTITNEFDELALATKNDADREEWKSKINFQISLVIAARNSQVQIVAPITSRKRRQRTRVVQENTADERSKKENPEESKIVSDGAKKLDSGLNISASANRRAVRPENKVDLDVPVLSGYMEKEGHIIKNW
jgi:hypothetical protein